MGGTGFLAGAGLIAALAIIMAGLWAWRRRSRTAGPETAGRAAAATLRVTAPHAVRSDHDMDRGSPRSCPSIGVALDSPDRAPVAIPAGLVPAGPAAAVAGEALGQDETCLLILPPSPRPVEETIGPALPPLDGDGADNPEPALPPADCDPPVPEAASQCAGATADGTVAQRADIVGDRDGPVPLQPSAGMPDAPGSANPAEADGPGNHRAEEAVAEDHPATDEQAAPPRAEPGGDMVSLPSPSAKEVEPRSAAQAAPDDLAEEDGPVAPPEEQGSSDDQPADEEQVAPPSVEPDADTAGFQLSSADEAELEGAVEVEPEPGPDPALPPAPETPAGPALRPRQPAVHRDRRGKRRSVTAAAPSQPVPPAPGPSARPPAEARLRLSLHPIRRVARLSVVLTRPDGFPARVTVLEAGSDAVEAYDEQRYDDLDLPWTSEFLDGELRLTSADGFQWLRSARQVHIFAQDPNEPELISTSAARAGVAHTLICRSGDTEAVRLAAAATGSPELHTHEHWQGIPDGWLVLSGYTPVHAAAAPLPTGLRTMDPGEGLEISFDGGLLVRGRVYAAGHPPRIIITPAPGAASVTIGGMPAELSSDGAWTAPGWDRPGQHTIDIVPGPSVSYEIAADPWMSGGWDFWDAHPQRFGNGTREPWARARICGALIRGPADETVLAAETQPTLVALGARAGATPLRRRADTAVSVGLVAEPPAFLLSATGPRRSQGRVIWLGLTPAQNPSRRHDAEWVAIVRSAAARHLPLVQADAADEDAWRKAKERARRLRNRRPRP